MKDQFLNCKFSCDYYDKDKCCECKDNYYLYQNDSLCYDNTKEDPFIKCAFVDYDGKKCKFCVEGYHLGTDDDKCCRVENCKITVNKNICLECDTFYCLDVKKQKCVYNDILDDINDKIYISCIRTNEEGTKCEKCIDGYQVNEEGYCVDIDYCDNKKDGKCLKCKSNYILFSELPRVKIKLQPSPRQSKSQDNFPAGTDHDLNYNSPIEQL